MGIDDSDMMLMKLVNIPRITVKKILAREIWCGRRIRAYGILKDIVEDGDIGNPVMEP
jgi:hypothetical protein